MKMRVISGIFAVLQQWYDIRESELPGANSQWQYFISSTDLVIKYIYFILHSMQCKQCCPIMTGSVVRLAACIVLHVWVNYEWAHLSRSGWKIDARWLRHYHYVCVFTGVALRCRWRIKMSMPATSATRPSAMHADCRVCFEGSFCMFN